MSFHKSKNDEQKYLNVSSTDSKLVWSSRNEGTHFTFKECNLNFVQAKAYLERKMEAVNKYLNSTSVDSNEQSRRPGKQFGGKKYKGILDLNATKGF